MATLQDDLIVYDGVPDEEPEWEPWVCSSRFGTALGWGLALLAAAIAIRIVLGVKW